MILTLVITVTAAVIVITAAGVMLHGRRSHQPSLVFVGLLLLLLAGGSVVQWMRTAPPADQPVISPEEAQAQLRASQIALPTDTPKEIIHKMGCAVCHKIPTVPNATVGVIGPLLILKTTASLRLASPEYQARVKAGKAHATNPKEYVIESIVDPEAFIVPGYEPEKRPNFPPMYPHYRERFPNQDVLNFFALWLLQLDEDEAKREGLLDTGPSANGAHP